MRVRVTTTKGDAVDRLTILQIKHEHGMPIPTEMYYELQVHRNTKEYGQLLFINTVLWNVEDRIREAHATRNVYLVFLLSREVIYWNRRRAEVKACIDEDAGLIPEPKNYFDGGI